MSEGKGFIESILAQPKDDVRRLVYADWLEEHAEPGRAEYLRLVHELSRITEDQPAEDVLRSRLDPLIETLPRSWREAVGKRFDLVIYYENLNAKEFAEKMMGPILTGLILPSMLTPSTQHDKAMFLQQGLLREDAEVMVRCWNRAQKMKPIAGIAVRIEATTLETGKLCQLLPGSHDDM